MNEYSCTLDEVFEKEKVVVKHVFAGCNAKNRLANLGVLPGSEIEVIQHVPGHQIKVKGSKLVLGRGLMNKIYVHIPLSMILDKDYIIESVVGERVNELYEMGIRPGELISNDYMNKFELSDDDIRNIYVVPIERAKKGWLAHRRRHGFY
jgi:Fe2+ transport system protein FeoA